MVHTSSKEIQTYNLMGRNNARAVKSATVVIFEDPKRRVVSLSNEAHDDNWRWYKIFMVKFQMWRWGWYFQIVFNEYQHWTFPKHNYKMAVTLSDDTW